MKETPIEEIDGEKMFLTECYALAGMVTYIEATGGKVLAASIVGRGAPSLEVEPEMPFLCTENWKFETPKFKERFDPAADLSGIQVAQIIVVQIGVEEARVSAVSLAPVGYDLTEALNENDMFGVASSYASSFAQERLEVDRSGRFWNIFNRMIGHQSWKIVQANWLQVERYRYQLETHEIITEFVGTEEYPDEANSFRGALSEESVLNMWKEAAGMEILSR